MSRRRRLLLVAATLGAFVVGFMFAWSVFSPAPPASEPGPVRADSAPARDEAVATRDATSEAGRDLEQLVTHTGFGDVGAVGPSSAPEGVGGERGLTVACDDLYGRFVGLHDDHVAIFAGVPGGCRMLLATRSQTVADLLPFQIVDLQRGIVFSDDDELFQILEGLAAP